MYAQLGTILFEGLKGFDTFSRTVSANIAQHAVIEGKPRLQKVGDNLDEVTFDMMLHSRFCDPETEFANLQTAKSNGEILPLINGAGLFLGNFVVQEIAEDVSHTDPQGNIILSRMQVTLVEHFTSGDSETDAAKKGAFANAANSPIPSPFTVDVVSQGIKAMTVLTESSAAVDAGNLALYEAQRQPASVVQKRNKAQRAFEKAQNGMEKFEIAAQVVKDHFDDYTQVQGSIANAKSYINSTITAIKAGDTSTAVNAGKNTRGVLENIYGMGANIVSLVAIRAL